MTEPKHITIAREIRQLDSSIRNCDGRKRDRDLQTVASYRWILQANHDALHLKIAEGKAQEPGKTLVDTQSHLEAIRGLDRLFFNYVSSAYSLSCAMNKMTEESSWKNSPETSSLSVHNPFLQEGTLACFMFALRNFAQHERLPLMLPGVSGGFDQNTGGPIVDTSYYLAVEELREFDWTSRRGKAAFPYLSAMGKNNPLLEGMTNDFTPELLNYSDRFQKTLRKIYEKELAHLAALVDQRDECWKQYDELFTKKA